MKVKWFCVQAHRKTWHGWSRAALTKWVAYLRLALPSLLQISEWCAQHLQPLLAR